MHNPKYNIHSFNKDNLNYSNHFTSSGFIMTRYIKIRYIIKRVKCIIDALECTSLNGSNYGSFTSCVHSCVGRLKGYSFVKTHEVA